jgi:HK97 family phage major capsid protein
MAHKAYENVILSNKINDILTTKVNLNNYLTVDTSLAEGAGMKKVINTYTSTGNVEELAMGAGNTTEIEVDFVPAEYEVKTYQGKFAFYDEQEMQDAMVVDTGLQHSADSMVNTFTALAVAEYEKATIKHTAAEWAFDTVVDAIAKLNMEDESNLFLLVSPAEQAEIRKALADNLKYSEGFVRTGYIGSVCGVPVIVSKAIPAGKAYLATKEAVTVFIKKDTETEYERDADKRHNKYWVRKFGIVALTDATKVCAITIG